MAENKRLNARQRTRARDDYARTGHAGTSSLDMTTAPHPGMVTGQAPSPVVGIHVMPAGPQYLFVDAEGRNIRKRYIVIGTARDCDVRLNDPTVSAHHCAIVRAKSRVHVSDLGSTNGVWVSGCRVTSCELYAGTPFTIGNTSIAAIGQASMDRDIVVAAASIPEFLRQAVDAYGTIRAAAAGLGMPYTTLRDWLRKK